jgi:hypothetical protein
MNPTPPPRTLTVKRQDGTTVEATIITRGARGKERRVSRLIEPVVGPGGDVIAAEVNTSLDKPGLRFVVMAHKKLILTEHAERLGYMFYRDLCLLGIPAEGIDPSPIHWEIYKKLAEMKANNQVPKTPLTAEQMYHPEVARRRALDHAGVKRVSDEDMAKILAGIRVEDTEEDIKAAKAAGLVVPKRKGQPKLDELLAEARAGA